MRGTTRISVLAVLIAIATGACTAETETSFTWGEPTSAVATEPTTAAAAGDTGQFESIVFNTSFGSCFGYCVHVISFGGNRVQLLATAPEDPDVSNRGTLTSDGVAEMAAALMRVRSSDLAPTYGCPDCADGGASTLLVGKSAHVYEFDNPPNELVDLDPLLMSLRQALTECESNGLITVASDCVIL